MHDISLHNVTFRYGEHVILQDVSFTARAGEFICLLGPSGCGKSTLLRLLAGLSHPTSGTITIDGTPVTGPGLDRGVVFQDYSLFPWMTTGENVALAIDQAFPGLSRRDSRQAAAEYLEMVGLGNAFDKLPGQMSGGMRQRAAIARAFAINAPVLLMDEPFGALDAITRTRLQDLLLGLWQQREEERKTILFVTHDVDEAILLADRIVILGLHPGAVRAVLPVRIPRPRMRKELYLKEDFLGLRDTLVAVLHDTILSELELGTTVSSPGEGI